MKILKTIEENEAEGLMGLMDLMGQRITLFCGNYIYTGDLVGVNDVQVKLDNPAIVYETGAFTDAKWRNAESLPKTLFVRLGWVESYGIVK